MKDVVKIVLTWLMICCGAAPLTVYAETSYVEKELSVNRDGDDGGVITLRFYQDRPSVPYVSAAAFHRLLLPDATMKVEKQGDVYLLTTDGGTAKVDVAQDTFTSSDYTGFTNLMSLVQPGLPNTSYDGNLYLRYESMSKSPQEAVVTFDFRKYGIDLLGDSTEVFFPFATLSDIYNDMCMHVAAYNGENVVVSTNPFEGGLHTADPNYRDVVYGRVETTDDMARFRYQELCFVMDNIFGYPGRTLLEQAGLKEKGLDATLDAVDNGSQVKQLLQSKNIAEFVLGMDALQWLLYDGLHTTVCLSGDKVPESVANFPERYEEVAEKYEQLSAMYEQYKEALSDFSNDLETWDEQRSAVYGDDYYQTDASKTTAVCVFDSFMQVNWESWRNYYASEKGEDDWEKLLAAEDDDFVIFLNALQRAKQDSVKNLIIDVTQNTGGTSDIALGMVSLMANQAKLWCQDVLTDQHIVTNYQVDRNFDGKFDETDQQVDNSAIRYAVLVSPRSFSCGNLFPSLMKTCGFLILGEQSGGGACCVQNMVTADGFEYELSSFRSRLTDERFNSIDGGVKPDVEVSPDHFYDIEYLNTAIPAPSHHPDGQPTDSASSPLQ